MSLKKAEKPQDVLYIKVASINTESQKTPAECRVYSNLNPYGDEHLISDQEHLYMMGFDSDLGGFIPGDD